MITYPPALRGTGFVAPRAIGRMGAAVMEARAAARPAGPSRPARSARPQPPAYGAPAYDGDAPPGPRGRTVVRLWLPSTVLFLLLSPFALLLALILALVAIWVPRRYGFRPLVTALAVGRVLMSLSGSDIHVDTRDALVRIRLL